jgi:bifunctional UDP-N-acetylglucosamine pyrophosphorylase/glucosamine-1-phosphate N-acetyltransferase/UDP-N-acetylglucosamine pyrophosphorylase
MPSQIQDASPDPNSRLAVVLAAGKGTRMKSDLPKVLCRVRNRPLIDYVLDVLEQVNVRRALVVVGYRAGDVQAALSNRRGVEFVEQREQLGTGHAVKVCQQKLVGHRGPVLVLTGDSPLVQADSLAKLFDEFERHRPACILGTIHKADPAGLGRILRGPAGEFQGIVEERDATPEQKGVTEVNMSTYLFDCQDLLHALSRMTNQNRQGEYYLTDCPGILKEEGKDVRALPVLKPCEALSVNTAEELETVADEMRRLGYPCAN